jgi:ribulose-5-phosphate 4-epimerase/fuculose-1-phosphate aldolase
MALSTSTSAEVAELKQQCLIGARILWREFRDIYGHVSCRLPDGSGFVLKMIRVPPKHVDPDQVMTFDNDANCVDGDQWILEGAIHSELLRARPDVNSVVHVHPHLATALSTTGKTLYAIHHQSALFEEGLPLFHGQWITTPELGRDLAACLGNRVGALLKGHGLVVVGSSVPSAVELALYAEQTARQLLLASLAGVPELFPEEIRRASVRQQSTSRSGGESNNLWRQLVWEMEMEQARRDVPRP